MRRCIQTIVCSLFFSVFLASCGGGGGSDSDDPALTFTPSTASATYLAGTSVPIDLTAHVTYPKDFAGSGVLLVVIEDKDEVLKKDQVDIDPVSDEEVLVTLHTSDAKAAGHYTGSFSVHLCKDAQCSKEYRGSPVSLPYDITIN